MSFAMPMQLTCWKPISHRACPKNIGPQSVTKHHGVSACDHSGPNRFSYKGLPGDAGGVVMSAIQKSSRYMGRTIGRCMATECRTFIKKPCRISLIAAVVLSERLCMAVMTVAPYSPFPVAAGIATVRPVSMIKGINGFTHRWNSFCPELSILSLELRH